MKLTREWMEGKSDEFKSEPRYLITSLEKEQRSAARLVQAIRGHWSVDNRPAGFGTGLPLGVKE